LDGSIDSESRSESDTRTECPRVPRAQSAAAGRSWCVEDDRLALGRGERRGIHCGLQWDDAETAPSAMMCLPICLDCGRPFDRKSGPMIVKCSACFAKPRQEPLDPYVKRNGILIPAVADIGPVATW